MKRIYIYIYEMQWGQTLQQIYFDPLSDKLLDDLIYRTFDMTHNQLITAACTTEMIAEEKLTDQLFNSFSLKSHKICTH